MLLGVVWSYVTVQAAPVGSLEVTIGKDGQPGAQQGKRVRLYGQSHALVIGINRYAEKDRRRLSAVGDAQEVAATLTALGFSVKPVMDPNRQQLLASFEQFLRGPGSNPDARLVIWFSGQAVTLEGTAHLLTVSRSANAKRSHLAFDSVSLNDVTTHLRAAKARHVLGAFDACFSDAGYQLVRSAPINTITRRTAEPARQIITSCDAHQDVSENGKFRNLFLDALTGRDKVADANKDAYLTATELGLFLADRISSLTENLQTPTFGTIKTEGFDRGNMLFRIPATPLARQQHAALTPTPHAPGAAVDPERKKFLETKLIEQIQRRLSRLKCYTGRIDGKWGRNTIRAINSINKKRARGSRLVSAKPDPVTLTRLQAIRKPVCQVLVRLPAKVEPGRPTAKPKAKARHGKCPANALTASRRVWTPGSLPTGESDTRRHRCGRRLTCVGGSNANFQPRRCRWL